MQITTGILNLSTFKALSLEQIKPVPEMVAVGTDYLIGPSSLHKRMLVPARLQPPYVIS